MPATYQPPRPRTTTRSARRKPETKQEVLSLQRARILVAAVDLMEGENRSGLTVAKIITRARLSRKTFYEIFDDVEGCFLAAFEDAIARCSEIARATYAVQPDWRQGMRAAVGALLETLEREPGLARLCLLDSIVAGKRVVKRRSELLAEIAHAIELGRELEDTDLEPHPLIGLALAGGILTLLQERLRGAGPGPLLALQAPIMNLLMMPYLGRAAAREELDSLAQAAASSQPAKHARPRNPMRELNMRVTYRTLRVLAAIRETPGASNRQVGIAAGIEDPGQMSKLLQRLSQLGLIVNSGRGQSRGTTNEWHLTPLGAQVQHLTRAQ